MVSLLRDMVNTATYASHSKEARFSQWSSSSATTRTFSSNIRTDVLLSQRTGRSEEEHKANLQCIASAKASVVKQKESRKLSSESAPALAKEPDKKPEKTKDVIAQELFVLSAFSY